MAVWSEIEYSSLSNNHRIEAEYYQQQYLTVERRLVDLKAEKITHYVTKITDGTHYTPTYIDKGVKFFSALNIKENYFDMEDKYKYISTKEHSSLYKRCNPEKGDILIRKVGVGPRWSCVIPEVREEFSIFVSVALLKVKREVISPFYLSTFINSYYGQNQLLRIQKGASQPDLHLEDIAQLMVPRLSDKHEKEIEDLVTRGLEKKQISKSFYSKAQQLLNSELEIDQLLNDKVNSYEMNYSEVVGNHRFDAQCYKPNYINYEKYLRRRGNFDYLRSVLSSSVKGQQVKSSLEGDLEYVSIKDIHGIEVFPNEYCNSFNKVKVASKNDILLAITGATIGKVGIISRCEKLAFSGDLVALKTNSNIDPYYLLAIMSNDIGQSQCQRWITGSTNGHLSPTDINKIVIPRISSESEKKISELLQSSIIADLESEKLLEKAKQKVENLIEEVLKY